MVLPDRVYIPRYKFLSDLPNLAIRIPQNRYSLPIPCPEEHSTTQWKPLFLLILCPRRTPNHLTGTWIVPHARVDNPLVHREKPHIHRLVVDSHGTFFRRVRATMVSTCWRVSITDDVIKSSASPIHGRLFHESSGD